MASIQYIIQLYVRLVLDTIIILDWNCGSTLLKFLQNRLWAECKTVLCCRPGSKRSDYPTCFWMSWHLDVTTLKKKALTLYDSLLSWKVQQQCNSWFFMSAQCNYMLQVVELMAHRLQETILLPFPQHKRLNNGLGWKESVSIEITTSQAKILFYLSKRITSLENIYKSFVDLSRA